MVNYFLESNVILKRFAHFYAIILFTFYLLDFPIIFITYTGTIYETSGIKGEIYFDLDIPVYTQNVQLKCNRDSCRWRKDDIILITTDITYEIMYLTINTDGVYILEILNISNIFQKSVEIDLRAISRFLYSVK